MRAITAGGDRPHDSHRIIEGVHTQHNEPAQSVGSGESGDGHGAYRTHGSDTDAGHDIGRGHGQLHSAQLLHAGQSDAPCHLEGDRRDAGDPGVGVFQNGEERIDKHHEDGQCLTDAQKGDPHGKQGHTGDGLHHIGDADDHAGDLLLLMMKIPRGTAMMRARTTAKQVMARWRRNSSTRLSHSSA